MQTPELLLSKLNQALRELRGAVTVLDDSGIDAQLLPVMRRLMLAEVMNSSWLVAVGGTQGAGKTTLVRSLYDLQEDDPWLPANEGRGETLPILIQESADHTAPQGYIKALVPSDENKRQFEVRELQLDGQEFIKACRGQLPEALLPVLRVPRRYFEHDGQALLLLPGYEKRSRENAAWQDLMRQALIGAAGCVVVTDSTRLANQSQQEIVRDMLANELRTARPVIVIAKTEGLADAPERLEALRQTAVTAFQLEGDAAVQQVICTGVDGPGSVTGYSQKWKLALAGVLRDMSVSGAASRQIQLARLEQTLTTDLTDALRDVRTQAALFSQGSHGEDGAHATLKDCLEAFDSACARLREQHQQMVKDILRAHYGTAWERMQDRLESEHEGVWNKIANTFKTVTETQRKIEADVLGAWDGAGSVLEKYTDALGRLTVKAAGPDLPSTTLLVSAPPLQRLGYVDAENKTVSAKFTDEKVQSNLRALMQSQAGEVSQHTNKDLERAARMLPIMALEYTRIASALPELVQVNESTLERMPQADLASSAGRIRQQLSDFSDASRGILKGIAAIMAVDVAADGHADIIDAILTSAGTASGGAAAGAAGMTIGGAVAATVAIGYLAHSALQEVRRHDGQVRTLANNMLHNTSDYHLVHFTSRFDELMGLVRTHLRDGLRRRYGLDQRLMFQDRLAKAMADVRVLQQDLLSQLAASGHSLALFDRTA
ncbi:MAG TPA: hypothetical protein VJ654_11250 [Noviherbaspirillum sp.]|nr:hypothetical protein [Noviherbaspirillum sp.]